MLTTTSMVFTLVDISTRLAVVKETVAGVTGAHGSSWTVVTHVVTAAVSFTTPVHYLDPDFAA
jgi:hypothetical protein